MGVNELLVHRGQHINECYRSQFQSSLGLLKSMHFGIRHCIALGNNFLGLLWPSLSSLGAFVHLVFLVVTIFGTSVASINSGLATIDGSFQISPHKKQA